MRSKAVKVPLAQYPANIVSSQSNTDAEAGESPAAFEVGDRNFPLALVRSCTVLSSRWVFVSQSGPIARTNVLKINWHEESKKLRGCLLSSLNMYVDGRDVLKSAPSNRDAEAVEPPVVFEVGGCQLSNGIVFGGVEVVEVVESVSAAGRACFSVQRSLLRSDVYHAR